MKRILSKTVSLSLVAVFVIWTIVVSLVDVRPIGPEESKVGLAFMNESVKEIVGTNMLLYNITDLLSIIPIGIMVGYASLGLIQWLKRKKLWLVDHSLLSLSVFYLSMILVYVFFEIFVINFRPVLIDGLLEASYPSSTTVLVMCVMLSAVIELNYRLKCITLKRVLTFCFIVFTIFMIASRLMSGVHWVTDIIAGIIISSALLTWYHGEINYKN